MRRFYEKIMVTGKEFRENFECLQPILDLSCKKCSLITFISRKKCMTASTYNYEKRKI